MCDPAIDRAPGIGIICVGLGVFVIVVTIMFYYDNLFRSKSDRMKKKEATKDVKAIKTTALLALFFYSCGVLNYFVYFSLALCDDNIISEFVFGIGCTLQAIGTLCVFALFSLRLNFTFNNTMFAISNTIKYYLTIVISLILLSNIINMTAVIVIPNRDTATSVSASLAAATLMFLVLNAFIILGIFVRKLSNVIRHCVNNFGELTQPQLNKLNMSRSVSLDTSLEQPAAVKVDFDTIDNDNNGNTKNGSVSNENMQSLRSLVRLIGDMSKYTILVTFATISTFLFAVSIVLVNSLVGASFPPPFGLLFSIDSAVNTACLVLQFEFYKKRYRFICSKPHTLCEDRYTRETNEENKNNNNGYQLKRLQSGEIGIVKEDALADQPPDMSNVPKQASLSMGNDDNVDSGAEVDVATFAANEATLVAQKSVDLAS